MVYLPHWPVPYVAVPYEKSPQRMQILLESLGNPHHNFPPVIHVAGTNGKGSTIAFLRSILSAAGYKIHRYTSPHLRRFNERILLADKEILDPELNMLIEETRIACKDMTVTFFEGTTAAAFLGFSRTKADVLLMETGLGGRLDPTNMLPNPALTIITSISYDHMECLGSTLEAIATQKAGIIKPNVPCIIGAQQESVLDVLRKRCIELDAPYFAYGEHWSVRQEDEYMVFYDEEESIDFPLPNLYGPHQLLNAGNAVAAIQMLHGFEASYGNICTGLTKAVWPARFERITKGVIHSMLPENWEIWLDGAHNPSGAEVIANIIDTWDDSPVFIINGRTKDRDIKGFLKPFLGRVLKIFAVPVLYEPKSEDPAKIAAVAQELGFDAESCANVEQAVTKCLQASNSPARIIITGSLYLAGDIMDSDAMSDQRVVQ